MLITKCYATKGEKGALIAYQIQIRFGDKPPCVGPQSPEEKTKVKKYASNVVPTSRNPTSVREEGENPSCSLGVDTTVHPLPSSESRGATCTSKVTARYWQLVDLPGMDEQVTQEYGRQMQPSNSKSLKSTQDCGLRVYKSRIN